MQDTLTDELCPGVDDLDAHGERARRGAVTVAADGSVLAIRRRWAAALHSNRTVDAFPPPWQPSESSFQNFLGHVIAARCPAGGAQPRAFSLASS